MSINVAIIKKSGGHLQFLDQSLHAQEYLNFFWKTIWIEGLQITICFGRFV